MGYTEIGDPFVRLIVRLSEVHTNALLIGDDAHRSGLWTDCLRHEGAMPRSTLASLSPLVIQDTVCRVRLDGKSFSPPRVLLGTYELTCDHRSPLPHSFQRRSGRTDDPGGT